MKIVIEIPEKTNAHIRSDYGHGLKGLRIEDRKILCDAIYHGTPYEERLHGKWLKKGIDFGTCWATCSVCNKVSRGEAHDNGFGNDYSYHNFCPNCGSDNRKKSPCDYCIDDSDCDGCDVPLERSGEE